ncbi:MAG: aspartate aminotransferase family protein [Methylophilaceae bacterium]
MSRINTSLDSYWLPFTPNRYFKQHPKMVVSAKGAYYTTDQGNQLFDCLSGLWCSPIGHGHPRLVETFAKQAAILDFAPSFQVGNPTTFKLAERIASMAPAGLDRVFFCNSGSEAVDTALKVALAYHEACGDSKRTRFIGRERAYHGVGFGGISVGGMVANRKAYSAAMLPGVDHLPHTWDPLHMAYSKGQPTWGVHLADDLERIIGLHDASNLAAVIVEPVQGSTGVIVPPIGYLQKLREICTKHGILLIFDEVITGFGRLGENFGAQKLEVPPDIITFAKAVTNGVVPLGGIIAKREIYEAFMQINQPEHMAELFHGYTYTGHPIATALGLATLDIMRDEELFKRSNALTPILESAVHRLKDETGVTDIRNFGLAAAVDLAPFSQPGLRAFKIFEHGFAHHHLFRITADTISLAPPFISSPEEIETMVDGLRSAIRAVKE